MAPKATQIYAPFSDPALSSVKVILRQVSKSSKEVVKILQTTSANERKRNTIRRKRLNFDVTPKKVTDPTIACLTTENTDEIWKEFSMCCSYEELLANLNYDDLIEPMEADSLLCLDSMLGDIQ